MHHDLKLSIAILNPYPNKSRERFDQQNVGHPQDLFMEAIRTYVPRAEFDVLFVADVDHSLPSGAALASFDAYIWTGSDLTIYHEDDERVTRQVELARAIFESGVPSFGSCWGIQMAVYASGGEVKKNPKGREWNIARDIRRTDAGKQSPLLAGKPDLYDGFIMHLDEVTTLSSGTTLLAVNDHTHVQAVEVKHDGGVFWATQYHPEYNLYEMARLIQARKSPLVREGFFETVDEAQTYVDKLFALAAQPEDEELRSYFSVGDDILDPNIRQLELRNWIDHLVIPSLKR